MTSHTPREVYTFYITSVESTYDIIREDLRVHTLSKTS